MHAFIRPIGMALLVSLLSTRAAFAERDGTDQVKATLIADAAAIAPGSDFTLGVKLQIEPNWHTYWINPGDSGAPTRIRLKAEGITFGAIQWPLPSRFEGDGFVSFGYEKEVLLMIPAKASAELKPGTKLTIDADVSWLCCHDTCIEGGAKLSISLPVVSKPKTANESLFAEWSGRLPAAGQSEASPLAAVTQAKNEDGSPQLAFVLKWKSPVKEVQWYPIVDNALMIEKVRVNHDGKQTSITFGVDVFKPEKLPTGIINSVVTYTDASGKRLGITLPVAVLAPEK